MSFDYGEIYNNIIELADDDYRSFHSCLVPGCNNIAGARIPALRALAKEIVKNEGWRELLSSPSRGLYEEEMLKGLVIGMAKCTPYERLELVKKFVPHIDNWAVCDTFAGGLKVFAKEQEIISPYIEECLKSDGEFTVRFAVCMLMNCFIDASPPSNTGDITLLWARHGRFRNVLSSSAKRPLNFFKSAFLSAISKTRRYKNAGNHDEYLMWTRSFC